MSKGHLSCSCALSEPKVTCCHCQTQKVKCKTEPLIAEHRVLWCLSIHSASLWLSLHSFWINFCRHWKQRNGPVIIGLCKTCLCRGHWAARALSPFWECLTFAEWNSIKSGCALAGIFIGQGILIQKLSWLTVVSEWGVLPSLTLSSNRSILRTRSLARVSTRPVTPAQALEWCHQQTAAQKAWPWPPPRTQRRNQMLWCQHRQCRELPPVRRGLWNTSADLCRGSCGETSQRVPEHPVMLSPGTLPALSHCSHCCAEYCGGPAKLMYQKPSTAAIPGLCPREGECPEHVLQDREMQEVVFYSFPRKGVLISITTGSITSACQSWPCCLAKAVSPGPASLLLLILFSCLLNKIDIVE